MTKDQITTCLSEVNEAPNTWTTLEDNLSHISLECDNTFAVLPKTVQFYFDNETELLFIRHTKGKPKRITEAMNIPDGYVSVSHNGEPYLLKLEGGGCNDITIGVFHEALSYEMIVGLCKVER